MKKLLSLLIATVLIFSLSACQAAPTAFEKPTNYASVVQVTINPRMNLYLDTDGVVLAVEYINADADRVYRSMENQLIGKPVESGMEIVVKTAADKGYLGEGQKITVDLVEAKGVDAMETVLNMVVYAVNEALVENAPDAFLKVQADGVELLDTEKGDTVPSIDIESKPSKGETVATGNQKPNEDERFDDDEDKDATSNNNPPIVNAPDNSGDETDKTVSTNVNADDPFRPTPPTNDRLPEKDKDPNREPQIVEGKPYCYYQPKENGVLLLSLTFDFSEGVCAFSELSYGKEDFGMGSIEYEGETYYEDGGRGDALDCTYEGHKLIIVDGDKRLILGPDANGTTLYVQIADPVNFFESFTLKPGTRLTVH